MKKHKTQSLLSRTLWGTVLLSLGTALTLARTSTARGQVGDGERGDVPGWVMITLMSAVLVAGLLAIAGPALQSMFTDALSRVQGN